MQISLIQAGCLSLLFSPEVWSISFRSWQRKLLPQSVSDMARRSQRQEEYDKKIVELQKDKESAPSLVIAGGGPAGLLAAILLGNLGIKTTVLERSSGPDQWTSKSFSLALNERGTSALKKAGPDILKEVTNFGSERNFTYFLDGGTGRQKAIPSKPSIIFTRPGLVQCLEKIASRERNIDLRKGVAISEVHAHASKNLPPLTLELDDGSKIFATHVIGADGMWSRVRQSFVELESQVDICTENFGVHWTIPNTPDGFERDGVYLCTAPGESLFYFIAAPIPHGQMSITMVCFDETVEKYPWLGDIKQGSHNANSWEGTKVQDDDSNQGLRQNLGLLLQEKVPYFFEAIGLDDALKTARINRRVTWLKYATKEGKNASYVTAEGTVVLIGDAAHGMTPSLGEGCNTALESAVRLVEAVVSEMINDGDENKSRATPTSRHLTAAFVKYGLSRPKDVIPIQEMSASRGRLSNFTKNDIKKASET